MALPTNISEATRRLNPQIFGTTEQVQRLIKDTVGAVAKKRIRQRQGGMNWWEREYQFVLRGTNWPYIYPQFPLILANGARYYVDFLVVRIEQEGVTVEGHEVKGFARSTGIVKVKVAATLYPWITFRLATKKRKKDGGGWAIEDVRP